MRNPFLTLILLAGTVHVSCFTINQPRLALKSTASNHRFASNSVHRQSDIISTKSATYRRRESALFASLDVDTIALVVGQENYGLAAVCLGEAIWSFAQAPSLSQIKLLLPGVLAALVLGFVSGPMVTSGDAGSIGTGLWIATAVSIALGASYVTRLLSPVGDSSKEIAALGLLVSVAGFFSFGQNLIVDGFVTLPNIPLPSLLPMPDGDGGVDYEAIMSIKNSATDAAAVTAE
ncbi:hypothetical protein MPSEU_001048000 [Mayamaea pseudoterrestris]|nr:hypothetical protein MPSEU_001048000 [Mayamaea pseudoterrestris]